MKNVFKDKDRAKKPFPFIDVSLFIRLAAFSSIVSAGLLMGGSLDFIQDSEASWNDATSIENSASAGSIELVDSGSQGFIGATFRGVILTPDGERGVGPDVPMEPGGTRFFYYGVNPEANIPIGYDYTSIKFDYSGNPTDLSFEWYAATNGVPNGYIPNPPDVPNGGNAGCIKGLWDRERMSDYLIAYADRTDQVQNGGYQHVHSRFNLGTNQRQHFCLLVTANENIEKSKVNQLQIKTSARALTSQEEFTEAGNQWRSSIVIGPAAVRTAP